MILGFDLHITAVRGNKKQDFQEDNSTQQSFPCVANVDVLSITF